MQLTPKNLTFPKCLSYSLEGSKWQKKGFHNIFVIGRTKIWILKCGFLAFLGAKMTKIEIQNPKLFVINDYQQFEWFLSLSNFWCKTWVYAGKAKSMQKLYFSKKISNVISVPQSKLYKKVLYMGFIGAGIKSHPLPFRMHFRCCFMCLESHNCCWKSCDYLAPKTSKIVFVATLF